MFDKFKRLFGAGKADAAALIREIVRGHEAQSVLFEPENAHVLKAYVEYGHSFSPAFFLFFLQTAGRELVKTYLEMGFGLGDKEKQAVLDLKDDELSKLMIDSGSWRPFPYGSCTHHPVGKHHTREHDLDYHEHEGLVGAASLA